MRRLLLLALVLIPLAAWADVRGATWAVIQRLTETYHKAHPDILFQKTIAVFTPVTEVAELKNASIGPTLVAYLKERLVHSTVFQIVERENLDKVLREMEFDLSGVVDPEKAPKVGEILGADLLLTGIVTEVGDQIQLSLQLVDTASAKIEAAELVLYPRRELLVSAEAFVRSTFQSPNGIFITPEVSYLYLMRQYMVQDNTSAGPAPGLVAGLPGHPGTTIMQLQAGYRFLPFLSVGLGASAYVVSQYLGDTVNVSFPGTSAFGVIPPSQSTRYLSVLQAGPNAFADLFFSPTPQLNIGIRAEGIGYVLAQISQDIQNMPVVVPDWTNGGVKASTRRVTITGWAQDQVVFGVWLQASAEYLISPRLALTLKAGYYWQPILWPNAYSTASAVQSSKQGADSNGTFAEYQGFDFARQDGTTSSAPLNLDPSAISVALGLSLQL